MARKKKSDKQFDLAEQTSPAPLPPPQPAAPGELPRTLEYTPPLATDKWRVERFDLLASEFQLSPIGTWDKAMMQFHEFAETNTQTSTWFMVRRLFGVTPLIPPDNAHPDDLRTHTREELCQSLGISVEQLKTDLEFFRGSWADFAKVATVETPEEAPAEAPPEELALDDKLLERFQISERFFKISIYDATYDNGNGNFGKEVTRSDAENRAERSWLIDKLKSPEWQKMLEEPMAQSLARATLFNEVYLRRLQEEMGTLSPSSKKFSELQGVKQKIESQYLDQLAQLEARFPQLGIAGRVSFRAVISDLNLAWRHRLGKGDNRLMDRIHTAAEIQFLLRTSLQMPTPRYRLGWTVAAIEAIHGMYDPNFRSQFPRSVLKKLDAGFRRGVEEARQELGEKPVDLEKGIMPGEGDDFADFEDPFGAKPAVKN